MKNCKDCRFSIMQDFGYSNYTVEGTTFYCGLNVHPNNGFDHFYGEDERLNYADQCSNYDEGCGINLDVEGDYERNASPEEKSFLESWRNNK